MSPIWLTLVLFFLGLGVATALKGKYILALVGFVLPIWVWPVTSVRLAKPASLWARWFYDDAKKTRAAERFTRP
jgi:hypothetical protein